MQPGTVLRQAMRELSDDETLALASALGMQVYDEGEIA